MSFVSANPGEVALVNTDFNATVALAQDARRGFHTILHGSVVPKVVAFDRQGRGLDPAGRAVRLGSWQLA
jgi:hypothetical protein